MEVIPLILRTLFRVFLLLPRANAAATISKTITVNKNGGADLSSIQAAINSIPDDNNQWIKVQVAPGVHRFPSSPTLAAQLDHSHSLVPLPHCRSNGEATAGDAAGHDTATSPTFATCGANFVARDITFKTGNTREQAVAVLVAGDKSSFYNCRFISIQDTLCDEKGRHYISRTATSRVLSTSYGESANLSRTAPSSLLVS
ncbi:pectinesterase [Musa troglodytarum]|uniref:pectinesterase n=1 Tax=Musa troglodytarum TaxID=320322 RepID=A0A9E7L525_9LILI|nr:pectinesterase [Musa troglodytarum]